MVPFGLEEGSPVDLPREALALVVGEPLEVPKESPDEGRHVAVEIETLPWQTEAKCLQAEPDTGVLDIENRATTGPAGSARTLSVERHPDRFAGRPATAGCGSP